MELFLWSITDALPGVNKSQKTDPRVDCHSSSSLLLLLLLVCQGYHSMHSKVGRQFCGVGSHFPPLCEFWESNSGPQASKARAFPLPHCHSHPALLLGVQAPEWLTTKEALPEVRCCASPHTYIPNKQPVFNLISSDSSHIYNVFRSYPHSYVSRQLSLDSLIPLSILSPPFFITYWQPTLTRKLGVTI